jgi:2-haloacid dehalogenase
MVRLNTGPSRAMRGMMAPMHDRSIDYARFEAVTFDCYGTLIDWETGLTEAFRPVFRARGATFDAEAVLERFAVHEAAVEAGPYRRYRDVLATALRGVSTDFGIEPTADEIDTFAGSVGEWPAFPDTAAALARLSGRFRLGIMTNCDDDLFDASRPKLGVPFEWVITAQQVGAYKPDERNFETTFERIGLPRERILHVAQSLFHDHEPAQRLGMTSVWIDRRADRAGSGATPPSDATPDATFPDMASFAAAATAAA